MQEKNEKNKGGRPRLSESGRKQVQISLQQDEVDLLKSLAKENDMNISRFIMACVKSYQNK